jgi:6,7-dimethyl-8-ribityllumazine synthase
MSSGKQSLSHFAPGDVPDARPYSFGVVVSSWNREVTTALKKAALDFLKTAGAEEKNIKLIHVPGSYELTMGAALLAKQQLYDAIICLGCVIQGETRHFDFICNAVANGITEVGLRYHLPVIFGVLTTNDQQQALERAGGRYGNKGEEAAATAVMMAALFDKNSL